MTEPGTYSKLGAKAKLEGRNRQHVQCQAVHGFNSFELLDLHRGAHDTLLSRSSPSAGCAVFPQWPDLGLDHGASACEPWQVAREMGGCPSGYGTVLAVSWGAVSALLALRLHTWDF